MSKPMMRHVDGKNNLQKGITGMFSDNDDESDNLDLENEPKWMESPLQQDIVPVDKKRKMLRK